MRSSPGGETGIRMGLKIPRPQGHAGSTPAPGTSHCPLDCPVISNGGHGSPLPQKASANLPVRIELELLAQVFGLVGRGNDDPLESFDSRLESADLAGEGGAINDFDSPISRTNDGARLAVLEQVV